MQSVAMLNVVMLSVMAPTQEPTLAYLMVNIQCVLLALPTDIRLALKRSSLLVRSKSGEEKKFYDIEPSPATDPDIDRNSGLRFGKNPCI